MGKSTPQAPTPVDPNVVAGAQTASNKDTALFSSQLSNANKNTPYGSVTNSLDPNTNQWTQNTTLSPSQQGLYDATAGAEQHALNTVNSTIGQTVNPGQMQTGVNAGPVATGFNPGQGIQGQVNTPAQADAIRQAEQASYGHAMNLLQPQMDQQREQHNAQLVAQGLNPNDAAWQNDMTLFNNGQNELQSQAANSAVLTGQGEQNTLYGQNLSSGEFANQAAGQQFSQNQGQAAFGNQAQAQQFGQGLQNANLGNSAESALFGQQTQAQMLPIQEIAALAGGGQVQAPSSQFNPVQSAPTDVLGAYGLQAQQQNTNYQAGLQQQQGMLSGLMGLGQAAMMFSDIRLKTDIRATDQVLAGLPLYRYRYLWDEPGAERLGVMAHEAQAVRPDAVVQHPSGFLMVDYARLAA